jgi:membrane-associated phospholipid phosphatase
VVGFGASVGLIILTAAILDGRCWRVGLRLAASSLGAGLVADGIKLLVARQRPGFVPLDSAGALDTFSTWLPLLHRESLPSAYGYAWQSFPSAHCATAAGLAVGLALLYPRGRWLFALFAALACWQRIDAQAHFLSDCLAGAAVGCFIAAFAARLPCGEQETTEGNAV